MTSPAVVTAPKLGLYLPQRAAYGWRDILGWILFVLAVLCWGLAVPSFSTQQVDLRGLLFAAGPTFAASLLLVTASFVLAINGRKHALAGLTLIGSILFTRLPTAIGVSLPLYTWTYKHLGVIDYIATTGTLDRRADIYHSWPGMFAFFAWVEQLTSVPSLQMAQWFTPAYQLALAAAIYVLARAWALSPGPALVAAYLAQLVNWVGQDYFAPQALALLLGVAVLAVLAHAGGRGRRAAAPRGAAVAVALVIFAAVVVSHQLTPYWLLLVIGAGVVLGIIRPWWSLVLFAGTALIYLAVNYGVASSYGSLLNFNLFANVQRNVQLSDPSFGQTLTSWAGRLTSGSVWLLTGVILIRRLRRRAGRVRVLFLGAMALGSFALLLGQSYGGEAIFRVFLYSVPGCSLLVGPALHRALVALRPPSKLRFAAVATGLLVLTASSAQAFYGAWFANRISEDSLAASVWILENADPDSVIATFSPSVPGNSVARYTQFADRNRSFNADLNTWEGWAGNSFEDTSMIDGLAAAAKAEQKPYYLAVTQQMKIYSAYYGLFPDGALDRLEQQLVSNPNWQVLIHTSTLTLVESTAEAK